jgi:anti-anti-sigma factor
MSQRFATVFGVEDTGTQTVVRFVGQKVRLSDQHLHILEEQFPRLISEYGRAEITLNLSNVECLASTTLGCLVRLHEKLRRLGGRLGLEHVTPYVRELLQLANLRFFLDLDPLADAVG